MHGDAEMAALVAAVDGDVELELALGELIGRFRRKREAAIRDQEAARLLPLGYKVAAERLGVCPATVYNRAARAANLSKQIEAA